MAIVINGSGTVTGLAVGGLPDGTVDEGTLATDSVTTTKIPAALENTFVSGRKNLIINGGMDVAQRGTSFTADGFSLDRWYHQLSGSTSTLTQEVFATGSEVGGLTSYLKQAVSAGDNYSGLVYKIEDVRSLSEGQATFSFYAKGTNPAGGNLQVRVLRMNTGSTTFDTPLDSTLTLTTSWQRFTYTFTVPTASGMTAPASDSKVYISIHQAVGDTSTTAWELNLTGVQLELGSVATDFEHRSYGEELALCQRYCYVALNQSGIPFVAGVGASAATLYMTYVLPVPPRATPTLTFVGSLYISDQYAADYNTSSPVVGAAPNNNLITGRVRLDGFSGLTIGKFYGGAPNTTGTTIFTMEL